MSLIKLEETCLILIWTSEYTGKTAENLRRTEIRKIKKKYGLDRKNPKPDANPSDTKYVDRAQTRRLNVGSENPFAKTEVASTETYVTVV